MPTSRPRHLVTETDDIARALDDAAAEWPDEAGSRAALLRHLVQEGHRAIAQRQRVDREQRLRAIRQGAGSAAGVYGRDYLDELRSEWPA